MNVKYCKEVTVQFHNSNHQTVRINCGYHAPSASLYLKVSQNESQLKVAYCDKDDDVIKEIVYNYAHILSYECDGWVAERPKSEAKS